MEIIISVLKYSFFMFAAGLIIAVVWYFFVEKLPLVKKIKNWIDDSALENELRHSKNGGHDSYKRRKLEAKKKEIEGQLRDLD